MRALLVLGLAAYATAYNDFSDKTKTHEEKVKEWKDMHSKDSFIRNFNKETGQNVKGKRADRLYKHVISLLEHKGCLLYTSPSPRDS